MDDRKSRKSRRVWFGWARSKSRSSMPAGGNRKPATQAVSKLTSSKSQPVTSGERNAAGVHAITDQASVWWADEESESSQGLYHKGWDTQLQETPTLALSLEQLSPAADLGARLQALIDGPEQQLNTHVQRAAWLMQGLGCGERLVDNVNRSVEALHLLLRTKESGQLKAKSSAKRLLGMLAAKMNTAEPYRGEPERRLRVLVVGGGPIGLRSAIEMALLGHKVTILEARDTCSRLNVLKLWEETVIDLDSLGLKHIDSAWSNKKEARASTARLQLALLKTALLLGVEVQVSCRCSAAG